MMKEESSNSREIVLSMLQKTLDQGEFSHLVIRRTFQENRLERQDLIFTERLFHGVLEQVIFLDWIISSYSSVKIHKIRPVIRNILRMSIYQMLFMDSVPDHAAINEAVKLTRNHGLKGLAPYVNGVLRSFQRGGVKPGMPEHVKCSVPLWLFERMRKELGAKRAKNFFNAVNRPQDFLYARLLTNKAPAEDIMHMLTRDGCSIERIPEREEAVKISHTERLADLDAYRQGLLFIQDLSSMHVGWTAEKFADKAQVKRIVDVCGAPGGKSLHLAALFPNAEVLSRDLTEAKVHLIDENIQRSGCVNVRAEVHDALVPDEKLEKGADIVLADLPCSGLGVIGRKPDIRLRVTEQDLEELAFLQKSILETVAGYVKPGGLFIYSTCTVNRKENQEQAVWLTQKFPLEKLYERQFIPGEDPCDGFYLACFRRVTENN